MGLSACRALGDWVHLVHSRADDRIALFLADPIRCAQPARFVGLKNYVDMFGADRDNVVKAFANVGYLAGVGVPLGICSGLGIAMLLNTATRGMRFYRTFFYLPSIFPLVAATVLWHWVLAADPDKGLVDNIWRNTATAWLHAPPPGWIEAANWSKPALIVMGLWGAGSGMILWLAGLKGIPSTLYEAAELDGASPRKVFSNVRADAKPGYLL